MPADLLDDVRALLPEARGLRDEALADEPGASPGRLTWLMAGVFRDEIQTLPPAGARGAILRFAAFLVVACETIPAGAPTEGGA